MQPTLATLFLMISLVICLPVNAQIYGDFLTAEDENPNVNIFFGVVKNQDKQYIAGATIILSNDMLDFVAISDEQGRFRFQIPVEMTAHDLSARCSHPNFPAGQVLKRLPRRGLTSPVELLCLIETT